MADWDNTVRLGSRKWCWPGTVSGVFLYSLYCICVPSYLVLEQREVEID